MARSKQQWRAEKLALRLAARAPVSDAEMVQLKAEHPQLRVGAPQAAAAVATPSKTTAAPSAAVIDLTVEDEEEEDEEMGVVVVGGVEEGTGKKSGETLAAAVSVARPSIEELSNNVMDISGEGSRRPVVDNAEEESDVDEAWPEVGAVNGEEGAGTPETQELEDDEDARGENGDSSNAPAQEPARQQNAGPAATVVSNVLLLDEDEVEEDEALPIATNGSTQLPSGGAPTTNADTPPQSTASGGEDPAVTEPATDWAGRILRIVETAALEEENLEDGEIFEEGVVVTSPTSVKRAIALERLASREDSGSDASVATAQQVPHQQGKKKHKKRGKKKSKRKLEAMMMDAAAPGTPPIGFERITRQHSFTSKPIGSYENAPPPIPVVAVPAPPPPPFGALPPPQPSIPPDMPRMNHVSPNYHQYEDGPPPLLPPLPPYEDNQILRVNRQGSVEMFSGNGRMMPPPPLPLSHVVAPPDHGAVGGGFKYRSIPPRMPPPPPIMRHVQQPHSADSSAASSPVPSFESPPFRRDDRLGSSTSTTSINSAGPEEGPADDGMDLDMLRAMALRTKRVSRPQPSIQPASARAPADAAGSGNKKLGAASGSVDASAKSSSETNDTDNLDEDALLAMIRSSQKRKRSQKQGHTLDEGHPSDQPSSTVAPADAAVGCKQSESAAMSDSAKYCDSEAATDALPVSTVQVSTPDAPSTAKAPSPRSSKGSTTPATTLTELPPTPVVRPLTACSQSLVIQLDEDDLMLADDDDVDVLNSPYSSAAPSQNVKDIRSAIDAMRRQIAEREKARAGSNKGAAASSSSASSSSSSSSSSSNSLRSSPRFDGQKKAEAATTNRDIQVVATLSSSTSTSSSSSSSSLPSPAALQAEIRAMKERIAAKEREKRRQHEQQRQLPASGASEPTARSREVAATLAMVMTGAPYP